MNWYHRALSCLLVGSMGLSMLGGNAALAVEASAPEGNSQAEGGITATLRMDYPITAEGWQNSGATVTLLQDSKAVATADLTQSGTTQVDGQPGASGSVEVRMNQAGTDVAYVDVTFDALTAEEGANTYYLQFEGTGFADYTSPALTLDTYSKGLVLGTGDATFTQGDVNDDGRVDETDLEMLKTALSAGSPVYDFNGDGAMDISDLALVTLTSVAQGSAQVIDTTAIAVRAVRMDEVDAAMSALEDAHVSVTGTAGDLFSGTSAVTFAATEETAQLSLPIPLEESGTTMEQIAIVSSAANPLDQGSLVVEYLENGETKTETISFDERVPDGVYPIWQRDDGRRTVVIDLGKRVPVKKVTIQVELRQDQPVVVEQIQFVQDVVPQEPTAESTRVTGLKAEAGKGSITLSWKEFPNITGYRIYYGTSADRLSSQVDTDQTSYTLTGFKDLVPYYFAVAPVSEAGGTRWEGRKSEIVSATPEPEQVPDKPDAVTVEEGDTLLTVTWKPGKYTQYCKVEYRLQGAESFQTLAGQYQNSAVITGLENDQTYEVRVYGVNTAGNGPVSLTALGTPKAAEVEIPELPTRNRLDNQTIIQKVEYSKENTQWELSKGELPGSVYDGDYRTSWIANSYHLSRAFTFTFDQAYEMDYLIYVPDLGREPGGQQRLYRSFFERFNVSINGQAVPQEQVSFEAAKDNQYFIIRFPKSQVSSITVEGSQWAGAGNISLSEIAFYQYDGLAEEIAALFANDSHTALAEGVDAEKVAALRAQAEDAQAYYVDRSVLLDELDNAQQLLDGRQSELTVVEGFQQRSAAADSATYGQSASALQPLGVSALSKQYVTLYVEGLQPGESLQLVQWQQYSETNATRASYTLQNGRNRIWLKEIGNSGSGERGGSLYVEYTGTHGSDLRIQIRDTSEQKNVVTRIPMLELTAEQWYGDEQACKELIRTYVQQLKSYVAGLSFVNEGAKRTNTRNVTEIGIPSVLLSLPANQVLEGLGGANADVEAMTDRLYDALQAWEELVFLSNKTQGILSADASLADSRYPMQTRQNIRFSRMFSGAFMFAAGSYVGIDYNETRGMVTGSSLSGLTGTEANNLYGWGIAHEIGHNMDKIGRAEITNNIYSLVAQTADRDGALLGQSRLETSGLYPDIFRKVAQGRPGEAGNVFVQLGMYWQLHLAYDGDGDVLSGSGPLDFYNAFFQAWKSGKYAGEGYTSDERIALIAGDVTGKDLSEFFTRWGMQLSQPVLAKLAEHDDEQRDIWYLSDESRRLRLSGGEQTVLQPSLEAQVDGERTITLTITVEDASKLQGYEILRNGTPIDFIVCNGNLTQSYTDTVGAANNMTFTYTVRAIDQLGYEAGSASAPAVRMSYDRTIDPELYEIQQDEAGNVLITVKGENSLSVGGIKLTGEQVPQQGSFLVLVSNNPAAQPLQEIGTVKPNGGWTVAKQGRFDRNESQSEGVFLNYFNKPGAQADDTRIWMYDARQIAISGLPAGMNPEDIQLLSYPGDNIAFTEDAAVGVLGEDYVYDTMDGQESIPAGTVIITGTYRGDPIYNSVHVLGRLQQMQPGSDAAPTIQEDVPLAGELLMLAEIPEDGQVSDISDGIFIFIPADQDLFRQVNEDDPDHPSANSAVLIELKAQLFRAEDIEGNGQRMTSDTLYISVPRYDSMPEIRFAKEN